MVETGSGIVGSRKGNYSWRQSIALERAEQFLPDYWPAYYKSAQDVISKIQMEIGYAIFLSWVLELVPLAMRIQK